VTRDRGDRGSATDPASRVGGSLDSAKRDRREDVDVEFHFDPDTYLAMIREDVPVYDEIQLAVGEAAAGGDARRILDLGAGTGETSRAVLEHHPSASVVLMDESPEMLAAARFVLGDDQIEQAVVGDLLGPLPDGPFDLVVSALAIHHLRGTAKRDLFFRLRPLLGITGCFVMADVVVPEDRGDAVTPLSEGFDHPSSLPELLGWLEDAAFAGSVAWSWKDVVVLRCAVR
jgi:tRNA (cmo5U34)-methyltransferase